MLPLFLCSEWVRDERIKILLAFKRHFFRAVWQNWDADVSCKCL